MRRRVLPIGLAALLVALLVAWSVMIRMPGRSHRGALPALSDAQRAAAFTLRRDVEKLATQIGERNVERSSSLAAAASFVESELRATGKTVSRQGFDVRGVRCENLAVEIPGASKKDEIVVVGAHYDSVRGCPGANDNATGVAALLSIARAPLDRPQRTLRLVFFVNEEPPHFQGPEMGSLVYARTSKERGERIVAMLSLETLGCYSDAPRSQAYPFPFSLIYPSTGNFVGFVGDVRSRHLVRRVIGTFRREAAFPSEGVAAPASIPGIGWSDQWSFWQQGYPAVMVTDTAPFRYGAYHTRDDTPEKCDLEKLARVATGLRAVVADLVR